MFEDRERLLQIDLPVRRERLQGREVTVACVPDTAAREVRPAGANAFGFAGTTGLATVALYLGGNVSENELVSLGLSRGLCSRADAGALSGGVSQEGLLHLLSDCRAPARAERGYSLEDLAQSVESWRGTFATDVDARAASALPWLHDALPTRRLTAV